MRILGIQFGNHDSGAALLEDGRVVAAVSEERVTRRKKERRFPYGAIADVLAIGNISPADIDLIAVAGKETLGRSDFGRLLEQRSRPGRGSHMANVYHFVLGRWYRPFLNARRFHKVLHQLGFSAPAEYFDHHLCHAASVYFTAGEEDPLVITLDGEGDNMCSSVSIVHDKKLSRIHETPWQRSPGLFYSFITEHLGMKRSHHEGKVTGLAAHGDPHKYADIMRSMLKYDLTKDDFVWPFLHASYMDRWLLKSRLRWWPSIFRKYFPLDEVRPKENFTAAADIAAAAQTILEESVLTFVRSMITKTGKRHLALAGGVFANVKLNQHIAELAEVERVFIHPAMGDDGIALGAAFLAADLRGEAHVSLMRTAYLGPSYTNAEIEEALKKHPVQYTKPADIEEVVANALANGEVVALFQGRMEYGPRALGNRSVIASPHDRSVNDWLNKKFNRTEFMPFAPVTLAEHMHECYTGLAKCEHAAHFMTICTPCTSEMERTQPAVVHIDGTARPQLITQEENPRYWGILNKFHQKTGLPSMINTSFNMHEEPIVRSPDDALRAFISSGLPYMVLENFLVTQKQKIISIWFFMFGTSYVSDLFLSL